MERVLRKGDVALTCSKLHSCPRVLGMSSVQVLRDWEVPESVGWGSNLGVRLHLGPGALGNLPVICNSPSHVYLIGLEHLYY